MYVSSPGAEGLAGDAGIYGNITEWAYETSPNTPIMAGEVPEPEIWVLLMAGGMFLACCWLRRNHPTQNHFDYSE